MSVRNVASSRRASIPPAVRPPQPWVHNPSWRALTAVGDTEQAFRGLLAVYPDSTFIAFTAAGDYSVDWGDGTTTSHTSGATALKLYDFNDADLDGTNAPVALTDAGDLIQRTSHGYTDGMDVRFYNITTTTGLTAGQVYYVINATANSFQVAATVGGAAVALTGDGSATLLPYKQAIVTVTPQSGQSLTAINLNVRHTQAGLQAYETGWLDIEVGSPNFTTAGLVIAANSTTENVRFNTCERVAVRNFGGATDLSHRFRSMRSLQSVVFGDTAAVTNMQSTFQNCFALQAVPMFNAAAVTNMASTFNGCRSLQTIPPLNTSAVTNMDSVFNNCTSLHAVYLLNTAAVTNMFGMFNLCRSLQSVPIFNTAAVTDMTNMFAGCSALQSVPPFNTAAVTNMSGMFNGCVSLQSVPLFNTAAVTNMSSMFSSCAALKSVPQFNTAAVTNMSFMFGDCFALQFIPPLNTAAVTNMSFMFNNCNSLRAIPLLDTAAATNINSMFSGCSALQSVPSLVVTAITSSSNFSSLFASCPSISRIEAKDFRFSFSVASCKLSAAALDEVYTNLPTRTGQTITVSNNWGTAGDNTSIATAKGWTVTG